MSTSSATTGSGRRRLWIFLVAVAVTLVVIWAVVALAFSSSQDGADRQQTTPGPADTLKDTPQSDKIGGNTGGSE